MKSFKKFVNEKVIEIDKSKVSGKDGLVSAAKIAFGDDVEVKKLDTGLKATGYGTIEVDGKGYDWKLTTKGYKFMPA